MFFVFFDSNQTCIVYVFKAESHGQICQIEIAYLEEQFVHS